MAYDPIVETYERCNCYRTPKVCYPTALGAYRGVERMNEKDRRRGDPDPSNNYYFHEECGSWHTGRNRFGFAGYTEHPSVYGLE